jgi:hypothetical protein
MNFSGSHPADGRRDEALGGRLDRKGIELLQRCRLPPRKNRRTLQLAPDPE